MTMGPHERKALEREWRDLMGAVNISQMEARRLDELDKLLGKGPRLPGDAMSDYYPKGIAEGTKEE
jgi:hypothetical protein